MVCPIHYTSFDAIFEEFHHKFVTQKSVTYVFLFHFELLSEKVQLKNRELKNRIDNNVLSLGSVRFTIERIENRIYIPIFL